MLLKRTRYNESTIKKSNVKQNALLNGGLVYLFSRKVLHKGVERKPKYPEKTPNAQPCKQVSHNLK